MEDHTLVMSFTFGAFFVWQNFDRYVLGAKTPRSGHLLSLSIDWDEYFSAMSSLILVVSDDDAVPPGQFASGFATMLIATSFRDFMI